MKPVVSIIMATYNRAHFIVETLQSIQNQTFANWECLLIDDGGTDNTVEIIKPLLEVDNRFRFLKRPENYKKGLPGCRNYGLDLSKGDYIVFFDDDDIVHPENLKISLAVIQNENVSFCHFQKQSFVEKIPDFEFGEPKIRQALNKSHLYEIITHQIGLASCTVLWNKECFKVIRFNEKLLYAEEWECYAKIISEEFKGVSIESVLYFNRKHPNSNTGEFWNNDPIRRKSKADAIALVIKNLKEKKLLNYRLLRYFIQMALGFKEYNLFKKICNAAQMNFLERLKWKIIYTLFPLQLSGYRIKKRMMKR